MKEEELWNHASDLGEGLRYQYRSWMHDLLATILAYYEVRGTSIDEMVNAPELRRKVAHMVGNPRTLGTEK
jgi:hypothetical protein